jgi:hypothetical protein
MTISKKKIRQKKNVNLWPGKHHTWHNHEDQSLRNEMLTYEIEKILQ